MFKKIGIFFGSDTGNTKRVSEIIQRELGVNNSEIHEISECNQYDFEKYNNIILGSPTWYYGELQSDWEDFFENFKKFSFSEKNIAIFGCGDQIDYSENFCDAIGILKSFINFKKNRLIGKWPVLGYKFKSTKCLLNKKYFIGLTIDEDRQPELTKFRINKWVKQIKLEMK